MVDPSRLTFLYSQPFAHRGLHMHGGPAENSLPAFAAAFAAGYGAECDVRLSADGVVHVFHDALLDRMTDASGAIHEYSSATLAGITLRDGGGSIPPLSALLALAEGQGPLLIEIKVDRLRDIVPLCASVLRDVKGYKDSVAIMSFHPLAVRWFARNAPGIIRGLVISEQRRKTLRHHIGRTLAMWLCKPDFLAYDIRDLPSPFAQNARRNGLPVLSWTVREPEHWRRVSTEADAAIFEGDAPFWPMTESAVSNEAPHHG